MSTTKTIKKPTKKPSKAQAQKQSDTARIAELEKQVAELEKLAQPPTLEPLALEDVEANVMRMQELEFTNSHLKSANSIVEKMLSKIGRGYPGNDINITLRYSGCGGDGITLACANEERKVKTKYDNGCTTAFLKPEFFVELAKELAISMQVVSDNFGVERNEIADKLQNPYKKEA
jgi:hypothetical protein